MRRQWWACAGGVISILFTVSTGYSIAAELQGVRVSSIAGGAAVALDLSERVDAHVTAINDADGSIRRLYVDLPHNTIVAPSARQIASTAAPVSGTRVGQADDGAVRVVIDVDGASAYRIERDDATRTFILVLSAKVKAKAAAKVPSAKLLDEARRTREGSRKGTDRRASVPKRPPDKPLRIVLDPGHGGTDPGAGVDSYVLEKDVTLAIATRVATLLRARLDATVVLTRTEDTTLELHDRTARANKESADLFVSIHGNSSPNGELQGVETYYLNNTDDRASIRLADMENGLDLLHPGAGKAIDLRRILSDMIQVGKMDASIQLARAIQRGLVRTLRTVHRDVHDLGVKKGPFYVLVGAFMPCVLVEVSFLNHPVEGPRLATAAYQELIAQGLYAAIAQYLGPSHRRGTL